MNQVTLPHDLQNRYNDVLNQFTKVTEDIKNYHRSTLPRYVSVPRFIDDVGFTMDYKEMLDLAERATLLSYAKDKPVRQGITSIGNLNCYLEDILYLALDEMTSEDD